MIDLLITAFDTFTAEAIIPAVLTLLLQLLLCFKAKKFWIKLLPVVVLAISMLIFYICFSRIDHLISVVFLYVLFRTFYLLLACGIGWGIWAVVRNKVQKVPSDAAV